MRNSKKLENFFAISVGLIVLPLGVLEVALGRTRLVDIVILIAFYLPIAFGITAGYHRLFAHRAFRTTLPIRYGLAILGAAAAQGPLVEWVADHRKHHLYADREGDPHSPCRAANARRVQGVAGFWHAHVGWLLCNQGEADARVYAADLLGEPGIRVIDRFNRLWVVVGLAAPTAVGALLFAGWDGAMHGLFWGGLFRASLMHHMTFSVNSVCHMVGARTFTTPDTSGNVAMLWLPTLGESWHHNHHRYPTSAYHGLGWRQPDPTALIIRAAGTLGLAWDIRRFAPSEVGHGGEGSKADDQSRGLRDSDDEGIDHVS